MSRLISARRIAIVAGSSLVVTATLAACGGGSKDTPEDALENFYDNGIEDLNEAQGKGDFNQAAEISEEYFCSSDVENLEEIARMAEDLSEAEFDSMLDSMAMNAALSASGDWSYEIVDSTENGDSATVTVEFTNDSGTFTGAIDLAKADDEWQICGEFF